MAIAGHNEIRMTGHSAFKDAAVVRIIANHLQTNFGRDDLRNLSDEFQVQK